MTSGLLSGTFLDMSPARNWVKWVLLAVLGPVLNGCGSAIYTTLPAPVVTASPLAGNWLLYGTLPNPVTGAAAPGVFAVSFDIVGNTVTGAASGSTTCPGGGLTFEASLHGTIAADGSFAVTTNPGNTSYLVTLQGSVPKSTSGSWSGSYTIVEAKVPPAPALGCTVNQSGMFTATAMGDVKGTYTGAGMLTPAGVHTTALPLSVAVVLQQGGLLYSFNPGTAAVYSRLGLTGSLQVQGFSCFRTGTITTLPSEVRGGSFVVYFLMDDGSALELFGRIDDPGPMALSIDKIYVQGGKCDGLYGIGLESIMVHR